MATRVTVNYNPVGDGSFLSAIFLDEIKKIEIVSLNTSTYQVRMYYGHNSLDYELYDVGADHEDTKSFTTLALAQSAMNTITAL